MRAVTYVREVAENIRKAILLPGGIYNYGSENELSMLKTAQYLKERLSLSVILKEAGFRHNLWMDTEKAREQGIFFRSTVSGLEKCIADYGLKKGDA